MYFSNRRRCAKRVLASDYVDAVITTSMVDLVDVDKLVGA